MESKSETSDRWVGVRFDDPVEVGSVDLMQYAHGNYRSWNAEVQWSDNGVVWTKVFEAELDGMGGDTAAWETVPSIPSEEASASGLDFF